MQGWRQLIQNEKLADAEGFQFSRIVPAAIGLPEAERFLPVPEAHALGYLEYVGGSHAILLVARIYLRDTRDIRRYAYMIVGDTDRRPYATDLIRTLAEDLEMPYLFRIRYRKALAPVAISVFLDQLAH